MRFWLACAAITLMLTPLLAAEQKQGQVKIICPPLPVKVTKQVKPEYPKTARESGSEGTVSLRCTIAKDGSVKRIEVINGNDPFLQAAKNAVEQWRYTPLVLNGVAVEAETTVQVIFQLPKKTAKKVSTSQ